MISYSRRAQRAIGFLKSPKNDVEIYVEDSSKTKQWLALIKNCVGSRLNITSVTAIGCRDDVISACRADQKNENRKRLYIIDGDFDHALGKRKPNLKHLYRLPAYCLENIFLNLKTVSNVVQMFRPDLHANDWQSDFASYIEQEWGGKLRKLFSFYAMHREVEGECVTSGYHVSRLIAGGSPWMPNSELITEKAMEIKNEIRTKNASSVLMLRHVKSRCMALNIGKIISGKTYHFPLVRQFLSGIGIRLDGPDLMLALAASKEPLDRRLGNRLVNL